MRYMFTCISTFAVIAALAAYPNADEPQSPPAKPKDITPEQQEKLKERDRLQAEVKKLRKEEKLAEAVAVAETMIAIERDVFGKESEEVAESLKTLAEMHEEREDFTIARKARAEVLQIKTTRHGEAHWRVTHARLAVAHLQRLTTLSAADRRQLKEAQRLENEVFQLSGQGNNREATDLCRKTLAIRLQVLGTEHPDTASNLTWVGYLLEAQGDYAGARPYYEQGLAICKKAVGPEHPDTALCLNNLGVLLHTQGDYAGARFVYEQALVIRQKTLGPEHPDAAESLHNLGSLYNSQGDYAGARPHLEQALTIFRKALGPEHPHTAGSLNNLGYLHWAQGNYAGARLYYKQALMIKKNALGPENPDVAATMNNLGSLLDAQGDYVGARRYHEQALAICTKALGSEHPDTARSLNNLGFLLEAQCDYAGARPYYEQALAIRKKALGGEHLATAGSLYNLGSLLEAQGDYSGARPHYEQALATIGKLLDATAAGQSERQQRVMVDKLRSHLDAYLSIAPRTNVSPVDSYQPHLRWKGAVLARQVRRAGVEKDPELRAQFDTYESVCRRLAHTWRLTPGPKERDAWQKNLESLTLEKEKLEIELTSRSDVFKRQQELRKLTPDQLRKTLPAGTALVDFLEYRHSNPPPEKKGPMKFERRLLAVVVRPDCLITRVDLGPVTPVATAVEAWRKTQCSDATVGAELRRLVWQPLQEHIADAKTVLISPDGVLARIPFPALPGEKPGTYLIGEDRAIVVIPVPQLLPELLDTRTADTAVAQEPDKSATAVSAVETALSLLLVGDVQFDAVQPTQVAATTDTPPVADTKRSAARGGSVDEMLENMRPLPGTQAEVAAIKDTFQRRFPKVVPTDLREAEATEAAFRKEAPRHRFLHLATHGFFAPAEQTAAQQKAEERMEGMFRHQEITGWHPGLLSGIVLAGAKQPLDPMRDDGILTALEVAALDLSNVDLAVLSACETGLGEVAGGEGILGLQRAFQTAGAKSVIATLWKIDDNAARALMVDFYRNMWRNNMSKAEALRQARAGHAPRRITRPRRRKGAQQARTAARLGRRRPLRRLAVNDPGLSDANSCSPFVAGIRISRLRHRCRPRPTQARRHTHTPRALDRCHRVSGCTEDPCFERIRERRAYVSSSPDGPFSLQGFGYRHVIRDARQTGCKTPADASEHRTRICGIGRTGGHRRLRVDLVGRSWNSNSGTRYPQRDRRHG